MKRIRLAFAVLGCSLFGTAHGAEGTGQGTVQDIYMYGNGGFVVTGVQFTNTSCHTHGFVVNGTHSHAAKLLSIVLTARAIGAVLSVNAKTDGCDGWYPEVTETNTQYIRMLP
jgi:hypothetical protein